MYSFRNSETVYKMEAIYLPKRCGSKLIYLLTKFFFFLLVFFCIFPFYFSFFQVIAQHCYVDTPFVLIQFKCLCMLF